MTPETDKKIATKDRSVNIVTTSGEYSGTVNLNLASVQINRVSDLFVKSDLSFLPMYDTVINGTKGREIMVNIKDIAIVIPRDGLASPTPELRKDAAVSVKLKYDLGQLTGKVNLWGETQQSDRLSDLLNFPGKKWLVLYDASYHGKALPAAVVNIDFISTVQDRP